MAAAKTGTQKGNSPQAVVLDFLLSLTPWALYIGASTLFSWKSGFTLGLVVAALIVVWRVGHADSRLLDVATLAYCGVMTVVSFVDPTAGIRPYNLPLSLAVIGTISTATLLVGSPFTYRIAEAHREAPLTHPEHHRIVLRAHILATACWSLTQYAAALVAVALVASGAAKFGVAAEVVATLAAAVFTYLTTEQAEHRIAHLRQASAEGSTANTPVRSAAG